jgi:hypothetical protein
MPDKPVKTETTVKSYDAKGELVSEVTTIVVVKVPEPEDPPPGFYL